MQPLPWYRPHRHTDTHTYAKLTRACADKANKDVLMQVGGLPRLAAALHSSNDHVVLSALTALDFVVSPYNQHRTPTHTQTQTQTRMTNARAPTYPSTHTRTRAEPRGPGSVTSLTAGWCVLCSGQDGRAAGAGGGAAAGGQPPCAHAGDRGMGRPLWR
jgi:hypothetical protein